jgi:hypothetical protein
VPFVLLAVLAWTGGTVDSAYTTPPQEATGAGLELPGELAGWTLKGAEWFAAERMFEKINGKAPFYLDFGAQGLYAGTWERDGVAWDMYVYAMQAPGGAEGVFISERPEQSEPARAGDEAYVTAGSLVFRAGPYYVQLGALSQEADTDAARALAREIVKALPGSETAAEARGPALPEEKQVSGTHDVIPRDAFGFSALTGVRAAQYVHGGATTTWFVVEGTRDVVDAYGNELRMYGGEEIFETEHGIGGRFMGSWEYVGATEAGVHGVRDAATRAHVIDHWHELTGVERAGDE